MVLVLFALPPSALADEWPSRTIKIIVPFPAGGPTDILARIIAQKLTDRVGQPVIVENRRGGNGVIGSEAVVRAPPDGYTFLIDASLHAINPSLRKSLPYKTETDFTRVALIGSVPLVLLGSPTLSTNSLPELISYAKQNHAKLTFGTPAVGGGSHLAVELLKLKAGVDMMMVPYTGSAPALNDLIGGHISLLVDALPSALPLIEAKSVKALGVTTKSRVPQLPNVPAIAETVSGYEMSTWYGMFGPKGVPPAIVHRLNAEITAVQRMPDVIERYNQLGTEPGSSTAEQFAGFVDQEIVRFADVVRQAGLGKID